MNDEGGTRQARLKLTTAPTLASGDEFPMNFAAYIPILKTSYRGFRGPFLTADFRERLYARL
jgi:hypothetical protein